MEILIFGVGAVFGIVTGSLATLVWLIWVGASVSMRRKAKERKKNVVVIPHEATKEMH